MSRSFIQFSDRHTPMHDQGDGANRLRFIAVYRRAPAAPMAAAPTGIGHGGLEFLIFLNY